VGASLVACGGSSPRAASSVTPGATDDDHEDGAIALDAGGADASVADASVADAYMPDATADVAPPIMVFTPDAGDAAVTSIVVSPLALVPAFSPDVQDYYVRCAAGQNSVDVTVTDSDGTSQSSYDLVEDQALVIRNQYWIRCLPPDFPTITAALPSGSGPTPGYYLVNTASYAMVLDTRATPVWYARGYDVVNVDAPRSNLIALMPAATAPYGTSPTADFELHAIDTQTTAYVRAVGSATDAHEIRLLANGDYLLFTYPTKSGVDLTGLKSFGPNQNVADCTIQEVDPSGALVWSWASTDHVDPVTESVEPATNTLLGQTIIDVFHCNSIDVDPAGNLLVSMRHANAVFYIDRSTGQVLWKLGGTPTNKDGAKCIALVDDPEGAFNMQHDARLLPNGDVSLFDDHGATAGLARGVEYAIDQDAGTATVAFQFLGIAQSQYEGSFRRYADGESVIGWGGISTDPRVITEVDSNGNDVFDVSFAPITPSYRAVKVPLTTLDIAWMRLTAARW
jgi:hypothetical protein